MESLLGRIASYRPWLPLALLFGGLTFFHVHLENYYSNVISSNNGTDPASSTSQAYRQPRPYYGQAAGDKEEEQPEQEGIRNGIPFVDNKPWLNKRDLMKYPPEA